MKITCNRSTLAQHLVATNSAASEIKAPNLSDRIQITATKDKGTKLESAGSGLRVYTTSKNDFAVEDEGVMVMPARLILSIIKELQGDQVTLSSTSGVGQTMVIADGFSTFKINCYDPKDTPTYLNVIKTAKPIVVKSDAFAAGLSRVLPSASIDIARPLLTSVLLEGRKKGLRLVTTDSYRLSCQDLPGNVLLDAGKKILIAARHLRILTSLLPNSDTDLSVRSDDKQAELSFADEDHNICQTVSLMEGTYPNYDNLFPSNTEISINFNPDEMNGAISRASLVTNTAGNTSAPVILEINAPKGYVEVKANSAGIASAVERVQITGSGENLIVSFNPAFLRNGIDVCGGDRQTLKLIDELKPAVLTADGDSHFRYLLMPIRS